MIHSLYFRVCKTHKRSFFSDIQNSFYIECFSFIVVFMQVRLLGAPYPKLNKMFPCLNPKARKYYALEDVPVPLIICLLSSRLVRGFIGGRQLCSSSGVDVTFASHEME